MRSKGRVMRERMDLCASERSYVLSRAFMRRLGNLCGRCRDYAVGEDIMRMRRYFLYSAQRHYESGFIRFT